MSSAPEPTTPTNLAPHGTIPRGLRLTPQSSTSTGRFGRMFRRLPSYEPDPGTLVALADTMIQPLEGDGMLDKPLGEADDDENTSPLGGELRLPAGYTYFGQFVDHDITYDPASSLAHQNDPDALTDFRTPRFDLDSLYGAGPANHPFLYDADGLHLLLGRAVSTDRRAAGPDLPRGPNGRALIGDPRNDENLIVSQLHVAFIRFHNTVVDHVRCESAGLSGDDLFKLSQQTVRWHYQWVVMHDFLPRLVGPEVVSSILDPTDYRSPLAHETTIRARLLFYQWREQPFMPVEFSVAAYRFGHSMVRPSYLINDVIQAPVVRDAFRIPLFSDDPDGVTNLAGFRPLPPDGGVQWGYFLPGFGEAQRALPQPSYRIDTQLARPLGELPGDVPSLPRGIPPAQGRSLAVRNLLRGLELGLPSGQDVARAMAVTPLDDELLPKPFRASLGGRWPLWYYVLKEAEVTTDGEHLGAVGGRIVAEVLAGLLAGDPLSYLSVEPTWRPTLPGRRPGIFTLSDLVELGLGR